ncbi:MAG: hypothetical protein HPY85_15340 [Anaerolineae bacterium]|jgi:hypothetical protein|nr:hypothetical protein [Anaerolineae bacterium]
MDFGLISKREKARRYAEERDRFTFHQFTVEIKGENNPHHVSFHDGDWSCDCDYFGSHGYCGHTMSLEIILDQMLPDQADSE